MENDMEILLRVNPKFVEYSYKKTYSVTNDNVECYESFEIFNKLTDEVFATTDKKLVKKLFKLTDFIMNLEEANNE